MNATIGRRIAGRRAELGMRQEDLARRVGVSRPTVSYWETGNVRDMKGRNLARLCEVLDVTDDWLLFGSGTEDELTKPRGECTDIERELLAAIRRLSPEEQAEELELLRQREEAARAEYERLRKRFGNAD